MAIKYTKESLLKAEEFRHIQPDFLAAILPDKGCTLAEAKKIVSEFERRK